MLGITKRQQSATHHPAPSQSQTTPGERFPRWPAKLRLNFPRRSANPFLGRERICMHISKPNRFHRDASPVNRQVRQGCLCWPHPTTQERAEAKTANAT
jgi:hypothetical protein